MSDFQKHIDRSIFTYPTLYRVRNNPELSRLKVLEHIFCVIGNGYDWVIDSKTGKWTPAMRETVCDVELTKEFWSFDLYAFEIENSRVDEFCKYLDELGVYHYTTGEKGYGDGRVTEVNVAGKYDALKELAKEWHFYRELGENERSYFADKDKEELIFNRDYVYLHHQESDDNLHPYPMCQFSALVEILNGKLNDRSNTGEIIEGNVDPDVLQGCLDVAEAIIEHYNNHVVDEGEDSGSYFFGLEKLHKRGWENKTAFRELRKLATFREKKSRSLNLSKCRDVLAIHRSRHPELMRKILGVKFRLLRKYWKLRDKITCLIIGEDLLVSIVDWKK